MVLEDQRGPVLLRTGRPPGLAGTPRSISLACLFTLGSGVRAGWAQVVLGRPCLSAGKPQGLGVRMSPLLWLWRVAVFGDHWWVPLTSRLVSSSSGEESCPHPLVPDL